MSDSVYIGLGSNLGDREANLVASLSSLRSVDSLCVVGCSSLYESAPVGPPQPRYLNAVVHVETKLPPQRLLSILKQIERDLGRRKASRWSPREIDLDILLWGEQVVADANLQVPHLDLHKRRFALEPLCELNPFVRHPVMGKVAVELLRELTGQDVVPFEATHWRGAGMLE